MLANLANQRCYNHGRREAAARCPECGRYYCRECVTEHDDRVVCAACLARLAGEDGHAQDRWGMTMRAVQVAVGLLVVWLFFYALGQGLLALPDSYHEGTVWHVDD